MKRGLLGLPRLCLSSLLALVLALAGPAVAAEQRGDDAPVRKLVDGASAVVARTPATDDDVRRILVVFGIQRAMPDIIAAAMDTQPAFATLDATQKTCVRDVFAPAAEAMLLDGFRQLFVDRETIDAWERFSETEGGGKFFDFIEQVFVAAVNGREPPAPAQALATLTETELGEVQAFMLTEAGAVLQKDFPSLDFDRASIETVERRATTECGWREPGR